MSYFNPYWQKALQYQQRNQQQQGQQQQRQQSQPAKQGRQQPRDDFGHEWLGKDVEIECVKGQVVEEIRGKILDISKYWLKLFVNNQVVYLNKAFILSIKPVEIEDGGHGGNDVGGK